MKRILLPLALAAALTAPASADYCTVAQQAACNSFCDATAPDAPYRSCATSTVYRCWDSGPNTIRCGYRTLTSCECTWTFPPVNPPGPVGRDFSNGGIGYNAYTVDGLITIPCDECGGEGGLE